jgi:hypothetical protein
MKGDFSRDTFDPKKHYSGVRMQQGRVQLDADFNEQQAINQDRTATEAVDVIGQSGAPKTGGGFQIGVATDGKDLTISSGRMYVDGELCQSEPTEIKVTVIAPGNAAQNQLQVDRWVVDGRDFAIGDWIELLADGKPTLLLQLTGIDKANHRITVGGQTAADVGATGTRIRRKTTVNAQPDYFKPLVLAGNDPAKLTAGRYLVYLDVWQRHITAIDDPHIREIALGGPDTATRTKTVWQVKLARIGNVGAGDCDTALAGWPPQLAGKLKARVKAEAAGANPCILPPGAGYQLLENQLYRIEVHASGAAGNPQTTFKWSRENGSVTTAIETFAGQQVTVHDIGRDDNLGFDKPQLVEVIDDRAELNEQAGQLLTITDRVNRTLTLNAAPSGFATTAHAKLRRWEGTDKIKQPANADDWISLEGGIQIQFAPGDYRAGDYWLIPARTATSSETGDIEWPRDDANNPLAASPHGIAHHYCRLGLVDFDGTVFNGATVTDCRKLFPPLTAITASDVSFDNTTCKLQAAKTVQQALDELCKKSDDGCTVVAIPGNGWEVVFNQIDLDKGGHVCFQAGSYPLDQAVTIKGKGHLKLTGCGASTRILAAKSEAALVFDGFASVTVRDLHAESAVTGATAAGAHLSGVLTFNNCATVTIERVSVNSASGPLRAASCLTARNTTPSSGSVRIRACDLIVGNQQVGILVAGAARATIEDNAIAVNPQPIAPNLDNMLNDNGFRALMRKALASNFIMPGKPPAGDKTFETVQRGNFTIHFKTDPKLVGKWASLVADVVPKIPASGLELLDSIRKTANRVLMDANVRNLSALFKAWYDAARQQLVPVAAQGIVIGGSVARDIRVLNNTIQGVLQGVHIGVSERATKSGPVDTAGTVKIAANTIAVILPIQAVRERHGIFVGNCDSLIIEANHLTVQRFNLTQATRIDGVRVFGVLGRLMIVRQNHLEGVTVGIRVNPVHANPQITHQWLVADNMVPSPQALIVAPPNVQKINNIA